MPDRPPGLAGGAGRLLAVAAGTWLLVDLWRVWTPSLITIFGQAASTPPEAIGGFAIGVMAVPLLALLLLGSLLPSLHLSSLPGPVALRWLLLLATAARVVLMLVGGGEPQLVVASVGVAVAALWLCLASRCLGEVLVPGLFLGLLLSAATHAALGSFGAVWRHDVWGWLVLAVQVLLVLLVLAAFAGRVPEETRAVSRRTAWLLFPALLLAGIALADVGRASTVDTTWGPVVLVAGCAVAFVVAAVVSPPRWAAALGLVLLVGAVVVAMLVTGRPHGITGAMPLWSLVAYGVGMPGLALCLARPGVGDGGGLRPALSAAGGALVWVLVLFGYYAGYDLGYRADWLVVALAAVVGVVPLLGAASPVSRSVRWPVLVSGAAVALLLAGFGPWATLRPIGGAVPHNGSLRVLAWNVRMGYGLDGRFDPRAAARLILAQHPDVVLLSEVDRGWLLNGGQDQLRILAGLLDMHAVFGPAADPVWGDAILTRGPVYRLHRQELGSHGSLTGAEALSLEVRYDGVRVRIVSTHLQPRDDELDRTLGQVRDLGAPLGAFSNEGPVVLGGDLNTTPGSPAWRALLVTGFEDVLAGSRPLPTDPADDPVHQIDHVIGSPGMRGSHAHAPATRLSDHRPVVVDLQLPRGVGQRAE
ncbi:MAG TPA: endonuclease/exonuclease/phosphatase family protein [Marmoricola sp.]|nr:endonuclease/exonuclease/phosphatase family protein [Marmoricola sp.]